MNDDYGDGICGDSIRNYGYLLEANASIYPRNHRFDYPRVFYIRYTDSNLNRDSTSTTGALLSVRAVRIYASTRYTSLTFSFDQLGARSMARDN